MVSSLGILYLWHFVVQEILQWTAVDCQTLSHSVPLQLLLKSSYSCLCFQDVLWPEYSLWNLAAAVLSYQRNYDSILVRMKAVDTPYDHCAVFSFVLTYVCYLFIPFWDFLLLCITNYHKWSKRSQFVILLQILIVKYNVWYSMIVWYDMVLLICKMS